MSNNNAEVQRRWRESAYYWNKHRKTIERMFAPITESLIQKSKIVSGDRILDLAGGMGDPTLAIAQQYGNKISITFTDLIQEMVVAARDETHKREITWVQFCRCSGELLPFANDSFNVIISRIGVMFFPDIKKSLENMLRLLKPGGRVSLAVWHQRKLNPMYEIVSEVLEKFIPSDPEPADQPGPFRFSKEGYLESLMKDAKFSSVQEEVLDFKIEESTTFENFWQVRSEMSDTLRDKLRELSADQRNRLADELQQRFRPYFASGILSIPGKVIVVSGVK